MARAFALREDQARSKVNSQWATFLQTLFSIAARRPRTVVILTSRQNRMPIVSSPES